MTVSEGTDVYIGVADADAHHAALGQSDWSAAELSGREAALLKATTYLDGRYRWVGVLADLDQPLGWPRIGAYDSEGRHITGIPDKLRKACAELARLALTEELAPPLDRGGRVISETVGSVSMHYARDAPPGRVYPAIDLMLKGLVRGAAAALVRRG
ncbi:MAG: hypothetical protein NXI19_18525 [Alphaproteobacteria bacterium]|nr:hypothetical protein [Alphaproteobacteria bacterium]